jgi:hypothetical protein
MAIGHKAKFIELIPAPPSQVPNNCLFVDSTNGNIPTFKDSLGDSGQIGAVVPSGDSLFLKQMQAEVPFLINVALSKKSNGKVIPLDSDDPESNKFCGFSRQAAMSANDLVMVLCVGANISNAVSGLGFLPGEYIYIGENGEYTNSVSGFTGINDTYIQLGMADCPSGPASAVATDLIAIPSLITYSS